LHLPATLSLARRAETKVIQHNPARRESKHSVKLAIETHIISLLGFHSESQEGNIQEILS
jgi:hypothetical protein